MPETCGSTTVLVNVTDDLIQVEDQPPPYDEVV
jgi:hypothetical protein